MIRVKVRYGELPKKVLWIDESIELPMLLRKIVNKLGVTHEVDDGETDLTDLFCLRLEDDLLLMRGTNSIEYGDELVLERKPLLAVEKKKSDRDEDVISISSDESEDSSSDESTEEEDWYEDEVKDETDSGYDENENVRRNKRRKRNPKTPIEPPLQVLMQKRDIPTAPGKTDQGSENKSTTNCDGEMEEKSLLVDGAGKKKAEQEVKNRIIKLLNTGFHDQSNEHEAKNAMKLAQRLMRKHNLSQAMLLKERETKNSGSAEEEEVLKGGTVRVRIVNRKTRKVAVMSRWIDNLVGPVKRNFGVKCYLQRRRGYRCDVVFYGIYSNAQLAGYAFKVATERISQMMTEFQPQKCWRNISTKSSRLSYAIGIVKGIDKDVERNLRMEEEQRKRKLERARLAESRGEAYEESDDEDFGNDDGGTGISIINGDGDVGSNNGDPLPPKHSTSSHARPSSQSRPLSGIDLENRVNQLEQEEQAVLVLVDHNEKVAEEVLKDNNIKLAAARKRKPIRFDQESYERGIEDSKEIDINQRAIRDEVKVKVEKR
jgi:hypothetical protein